MASKWSTPLCVLTFVWVTYSAGSVLCMSYCHSTQTTKVMITNWINNWITHSHILARERTTETKQPDHPISLKCFPLLPLEKALKQIPNTKHSVRGLGCDPKPRPLIRSHIPTVTARAGWSDTAPNNSFTFVVCPEAVRNNALFLRATLPGECAALSSFKIWY